MLVCIHVQCNLKGLACYFSKIQGVYNISQMISTWLALRSMLLWFGAVQFYLRVLGLLYWYLDCCASEATLKTSGFNTLRLRQNGRHLSDDIFKWIFLNEIVWISTNISLKCVPWSPINNIPTLVQVMAWCRPGDKPLSEPMMVRLPMHICVTRPQWVNRLNQSTKTRGRHYWH